MYFNADASSLVLASAPSESLVLQKASGAFDKDCAWAGAGM